MSKLIIDGDPGAIDHLVDELVERNYLGNEFRWEVKDDMPLGASEKIHYYDHIYFIKMSSVTWNCCNRTSHDVLGCVYLHREWDEYIFEPTMAFTTIHSASCLRDIADFLERLER